MQCNTTLSAENASYADGSGVSDMNSPVDGSSIPEEPSPPEDDPEGEAVLAGGAELSEVALLVLVAVEVSTMTRGTRACRVI
jgi:hypothetical protein